MKTLKIILMICLLSAMILGIIAVFTDSPMTLLIAFGIIMMFLIITILMKSDEKF
jgi:membrane protein YdbS with pleckstrin-like domain